MKPQHFAALAGFLLVAAVVLLVAGRPAGSQSGAAAKAPARVVTVTGEGEVKVKPDIFTVTFGVTAHTASAVDAEAVLAAPMKNIVAAVVQAGADETRTETTPVVITPDTYQDFSGAVHIAGFGAKGTVTAVVTHLTKVQAVIDAAMAAGATSKESAYYSVDSPESYKQAAIKAALTNAADRASAMVRAGGDRLGAIQSMEVVAVQGADRAPTSGGLSFRAEVKATYEY